MQTSDFSCKAFYSMNKWLAPVSGWSLVVINKSRKSNAYLTTFQNKKKRERSQTSLPWLGWQLQVAWTAPFSFSLTIYCITDTAELLCFLYFSFSVVFFSLFYQSPSSFLTKTDRLKKGFQVFWCPGYPFASCILEILGYFLFFLSTFSLSQKQRTSALLHWQSSVPSGHLFGWRTIMLFISSCMQGALCLEISNLQWFEQCYTNRSGCLGKAFVATTAHRGKFITCNGHYAVGQKLVRWLWRQSNSSKNIIWFFGSITRSRKDHQKRLATNRGGFNQHTQFSSVFGCHQIFSFSYLLILSQSANRRIEFLHCFLNSGLLAVVVW